MFTSLDRYILRQILLPAILAFLMIGFLAISTQIQREATDIPRGFLTPFDFVMLVIFLLPSVVSLLVPVAFFIGILMAFGRLAQQGEIAAMQASGISLKRLTLGVLVCGAALSIVSFVLQDRLHPWGMRQAFGILYQELPQRATIDKLDAGELHTYGDFRVYFARKDSETHTLYEFDLIQPTDDGIVLFHADEAQLAYEDGVYELRMRKGYSISQRNIYANFNVLRKPIEAPSFEEFDPLDDYEVSISRLFAEERRMTAVVSEVSDRSTRNELRRLRQDIGERIADPFAALAVAMVGAPMGVQARRKGRTSLFSAGFGVMIGYYAIRSLAGTPELTGMSETISRALIPNLVLVSIGLFLLWRADRA